jgi:hypothetical protein
MGEVYACVESLLMKRRSRGFVLFSVMLIIMIITLFSVMLLQTDAATSRLARMSAVVGVGSMKAKALVQALMTNGVGDAVHCDSAGLAPNALLHASDAWWAMHGCAIGPHALFVRESPRVSALSIIATPAGWVAAQYYYLTLRYPLLDAEPILMQALIAEPSSVKVPNPQGRVIAAPGIQQLACLTE